MTWVLHIGFVVISGFYSQQSCQQAGQILQEEVYIYEQFSCNHEENTERVGVSSM